MIWTVVWTPTAQDELAMYDASPDRKSVNNAVDWIDRLLNGPGNESNPEADLFALLSNRLLSSARSIPVIEWSASFKCD